MQRFDFLNRANAEYVDRLYEQYRREPRSLDETWQAYFAGFDDAGGGLPPPITRSIHKGWGCRTSSTAIVSWVTLWPNSIPSATIDPITRCWIFPALA